MKQLLENPFVPNLAETARLLAFAPSLHHRTALSMPGRRPFSSISHGFRNQKTDPAGVQADIVEVLCQPSQSIIVGWPSDGSQLREARTSAVSIATTTASGQGEITPKEGVQTPSIALARQYNLLSNQVRRSSPSTEPHSQHGVRMQTHKRTIFRQSSSLSWDLKDLVLEIDSHRYFAYTAISSTPSSFDSGAHQKFCMHIPVLGTNIEYRLHSLLTYGESLRRNVEGSSTALEANPRSPMPCKVLSVPKKDGEVIDIGEVGMVVESMKMEMNVLASTKGVFKTMFQQGDAVEEGMVLFTVT
jgi:biotin carboxyl carrier protein